MCCGGFETDRRRALSFMGSGAGHHGVTDVSFVLNLECEAF